MKKKKQLGIETVSTLHGQKYAVVDYSKKEKEFSRVLKFKEMEEYEESGKLPAEVHVKEVYSQIAVFSTLSEAKKFIARKKVKSAESLGIFSNTEQIKQVRKLCSK